VDDDGLTDLQEFCLRLQPLGRTDASLIDDLVQFNNLDVRETNARWPGAHGGGRRRDVFSNSASGDFSFSCASATACPSAAQTGRYGSALAFDGTNDYVGTTTTGGIELGKASSPWPHGSRPPAAPAASYQERQRQQLGAGREIVLSRQQRPANLRRLGNNYIYSPARSPMGIGTTSP
jgi:hypothetical protein